MKGKVIAVILTGLMVLGVVGIGECIEGKRTVSERFIVQIDSSSMDTRDFQGKS